MSHDLVRAILRQQIFRSLIVTVLVSVCSGCGTPRLLQQERIGTLGYFEFRQHAGRVKGVVIGAPRGGSEPVAAEYAKWISEQTGAALVIGYGFGARRLAVARPLVRSISYPPLSEDPVQRGSVYSEFKELLQKTADGSIRFYVGVRSEHRENQLRRIEVTTGGLTFEQMEALKRSFIRIRNLALANSPIPEIPIAIQALNESLARISHIKHHGVLLIAEKGLNLHLPPILSKIEIGNAYRDILSSWVAEAVRLVTENSERLPSIQVTLLEHGRIESIPSKNHRTGIVIAAPHGTFDEYTADLVKNISYRIGVAAVVAMGFTPTECGGWRINVNRPTERLYPSGGIEIRSRRAQNVYVNFKQAVLKASQHDLNLYIDIHQNGRRPNIEVATVGISKQEANLIKKTYDKVRHQVLKSFSGVAPVELLIEPLDEIEIGAWPAKARGILAVAKRSLHFELPLYEALGSMKARQAYTDILTLLLQQTIPALVNPRTSRIAERR